MNWDAVGAIGEIVGAVAVILTFGFLALQIRQNTAALRTTNDNILYQFRDSQFASLSENEELAAIVIKLLAGEELSEIEQLRGTTYAHRVMATWELAFTRHSVGQMSPDQWEAWDQALVVDIVPFMTQETWAIFRQGYSAEFITHVDSHIADKEA